MDAEIGAGEILDEIDFGSSQVFHRNRVDQHPGPVAGDDEIIRRFGIVEGETVLDPEQPPPETLTRRAMPGLPSISTILSIRRAAEAERPTGSPFRPAGPASPAGAPAGVVVLWFCGMVIACLRSVYQ